MTPDDVERLVRQALAADSAFAVTSERDGRYVHLTVTLTDQAQEAPGRSARIRTTGAELFLLDLDGCFTYHDSEYDDGDQVDVVVRLARLAALYLRGAPVEKREIRSRWGRTRQVLELERDGERFLFTR